MRRVYTAALVSAAALFFAAGCDCPCMSSSAHTLTAASGATDAGMPLDENGYIREWLVLGPINFGSDYNADDIDKPQVANEANFMPKAGDKVTVKSDEGDGTTPKIVDKQLTWQPVKTEDFFIDFNEAFKMDSSENVGAYAVAYLEAPQEIKGVTFSLSTNDDGVIYFNGKNVFKYVGGRALAEDSDTVPNLTLNKGMNTVVFKVWNDANAWQGCIRLLDKDGKPVNNVRVHLAR